MQTTAEIRTKVCKDCGETKPVGEFYRDAKAKDGLKAICKACEKARKAKRSASQNKAPGLDTEEKMRQLADYLINCDMCGADITLVGTREVFYRTHVRTSEGKIICMDCAKKIALQEGAGPSAYNTKR